MRDLKLYGSNDGTTYIQFHTITDYVFVNHGTGTYEPSISFPTQEFKHIVFHCTKIGLGNPLGQNVAVILEMDFSYV